MKPSIRYSTNATALPPTDSVFPGLRIPSNPMDQPPLCLAQCHPSTRTLPRRDKGQVHTVRPVVTTKNGKRSSVGRIWLPLGHQITSFMDRNRKRFWQWAPTRTDIVLYPSVSGLCNDTRGSASCPGVVGGEEICYVDFFFLG